MIRTRTSIRVVHAQAKVEPRTTLAGNARFGIVSTVTENDILTPATVGGIMNILRMINWIAGRNILAIINPLGSNIVNVLPGLK